VWIVDARNVCVPLIWDESPGTILIPEGCENLSIGTVAELGVVSQGSEAIDLNSFNRFTHCDLVIGTRPKEEVVDLNNSPDSVFQDIKVYDGGRVLRQRVYPPTGRRLTQKPYIDTSDGSVLIRGQVIHKKIKSWQPEFEVKNLLKNLPLITVKTKLTGIFKDGSKEELLNRTYYLDLSTPSLQYLERIPCNRGCQCARCKADPSLALP